MAIAFGANGSVGAGTTQVTPGFPTGITAGQLLVLYVVNKYPTNAPTTPAGWTLLDRATGGAGAAGAGSGTIYVSVYYKIADGTETGTQTVDIPSGNAAWSRMDRYTKAADKTWALAATNGSDNTADTAWSVTGAADIGLIAADLVLAISGTNTSGITFTGDAIACSGITFGTSTERADAGTGQGDDCSGYVCTSAVSSGTSSGAPSITATAASSTATAPTGGTVFVRLREIDNSGAAAITTAGDTVSAAGTVDVVGAAAITAGADTVAAAGTIAGVGDTDAPGAATAIT